MTYENVYNTLLSKNKQQKMDNKYIYIGLQLVLGALATTLVTPLSFPS